MSGISQERFDHMRANRDLWVRRHSELEGLIRTIRWQIERFEEGVEHTSDWRYECSADDLVALGWARVLCDLAFEPPVRRPEGHVFR